MFYFYNRSKRRREVLRVTSMRPPEMRAVLPRTGAFSVGLPGVAPVAAPSLISAPSA